MLSVLQEQASAGLRVVWLVSGSGSYGTIPEAGSDGWLSPASFSVVTIARMEAAAGRPSKVASLSSTIFVASTAFGFAALVTVARYFSARRASSQSTNTRPLPAAPGTTTTFSGTVPVSGSLGRSKPKAYQLTADDEFGATLFVSHHLKELDSTYWKKHLSTETPEPRRVLELLELHSHWGGDDEIDTFDFTLPEEVTNYVISVSYDDSGDVSEITMES